MIKQMPKINMLNKELSVDNMQKWLELTSEFDSNFNNFWKIWDILANDFICAYEYDTHSHRLTNDYTTVDNNFIELKEFLANEKNNCGKTIKNYRLYQNQSSSSFSDSEKKNIYKNFTGSADLQLV